MRKITALFLVLVLTMAVVPLAHAATYEYAVEGGNLTFDPTTGTITKCDKSVYSADIPSEIYGVPVKAIGNRAFSYCKKLTSITIPNTVTRIGKGAFFGCSQLTSIVIPDSVTVMEGTSGAIADHVFSGEKLETITIPGSIKKTSYLFSGWSDDNANLKTITFGDGIEEIGRETFYFCKNLENITFPDSVKTVSSNAFYHCPALKSVTFGSGLKNIDSSAFVQCANVSSLYFRGDAPAATDKMITKFADGFMIYYPEGASGWTTPTWNGFITKPYKLSNNVPAQSQPSAPAAPAATQPASNLVTAVPTSSPVYVNGVQVKFDAYNINKNNYFKLRDLAFVLSGTEVQFNVEWKDAVAMTSGQPYTPVGGELAAGSGVNQIAKPTSSAVLLDGNPVNLAAYNINGNNYFKLRDIGSLFNFGVRWDGTLQGVVIQTDEPYMDV